MNDQEIVRAAGETVMGWAWEPEEGIAGGFVTSEGDWVSNMEWDPLSQMNYAGMLIDAMRGKGWGLVAEVRPTRFLARFWHCTLPVPPTVTEHTLARAITLAALRALEVPNA